MKRILFAIFLVTSMISSLAQGTSYFVSPTPTNVQQDKTWACWAAVYTMMHGWKYKEQLTIQQATKKVNPRYEALYTANRGITALEKDQFIRDARLKSEAPQNYTIAGWVALLKTHGPLWVTTNEDPTIGKYMIHARVLYGIAGDGTPGKTDFYFIDPQGGPVIEKFSDFIPKFESEVRNIYRKLNGAPLPSGYTLRIQVIHW